MAEARKKMGCRKCMIAFRDPSKKDDISFLTPVVLKDLEELQYNYTYAEGNNFADNVQNIAIKKPRGAEIQLTFSDIKSKMIAEIMGKKYEKGGYLTDTSEQAKPVAILFQETYSDDTFKNTVFYNVKLAIDENTAKTAGENYDFTPVVLKGKAIPFTNSKVEEAISYVLDSGESDVDKEILKTFFETVLFPAKKTTNA